MTELEMQFHNAMIRIYETAKEKCDYNATRFLGTRFLGMISEKGGLATAHTLLATDDPSDGFTTLWECDCLGLTVEAHVLKEEFATLFTEEEKSIARRRLEDYGYKSE